jgi:hypothetical protein
VKKTKVIIKNIKKNLNINMKIVLTGLRDLSTDDKIMSQRDYGIFLVASLLSEEKYADDDEIKYKLKISHIQSIDDLKEHKQVKFENKRTPSQKLRWVIINKLGSEDEYESFLKFLMCNMDKLTDEYIENLKICQN